MFTSLTTRAGRSLIVITLALAFAPTVASARMIDAVPTPVQDLRSPDTRDAANRNQSPTSSLAGTTSPPSVRGSTLAVERDWPSYPSPVNYVAASRIEARQDLRSPDTRDAAFDREFPPTPTVVSLKEIPPVESAPGFDWTAAAAGAVTLGLLLLMTGAIVIVTRRRAHRPPVAVG